MTILLIVYMYTCSTVANLPEAVEFKSDITSANDIHAGVASISETESLESNLSDTPPPSIPTTSSSRESSR